MAIAKVILNGVTQMDVTGKTVTAGSMLSGATALKNDGTDITGDIESKTSSDLTVNGATVTAPAGHYASAASKSVASGSAGTPTASKGTVSNHSVSVTPSVTNTTGYITGGTKTGTAVTVSASELVSGTKTISASGTTDVTNYESASVAAGSAATPATTITANPTVSVNSSGLITATVSKTQSVTPSVSAGYVSSGTAGTVTVSGSGTSQLTTQVAQTIHPSTTDQTIASGKYLTGTQTIKAVTTTNLTAANIVQGVTVKVGDSTDDDCVASVTGTAETGGDDFIITLTKNASTGIWEPDCTYAELYAAYTDGKTIAVVTEVGFPAQISILTDPSFDCTYTVDDDLLDTSAGTEGINSQTCRWTSTGVSLRRETPTYNTYDADAVPADVASGKVFYNADGKQTGTASGGGGSDADYIAMIERTTAVTSLPAGVTTIGPSAFRTCSNLALTSLPSGVTTIGEYAFTGCSYLALTSLPSGLKSIGTSAFTDCTRIAITSLPNTMTSVGTAAFARCRNILTISCDGAITSLGSNAFNGDSSNPMQLAHVSFPNLAVNSLSTAFGSTSAAQACQLLEDADIGNTRAVAANAFANCYKLQTLVLRRSDAICTLSNVSAFNNTPMRGYNSLSGTIYVPSALISTYQTATNWSTIYGEGHVTFAAIEGSQYEL